MARLRRLLLVLPAALAAERRGRGLSLARAAEVAGARSAAEIRADVEAVQALLADPGEGEMVALTVEDDEIRVLSGHWFGDPTTFSLAEAAVLLAALEPLARGGPRSVAARVVRKLRRAVPEPLVEECDRLVQGLDVLHDAGGPWVGALQAAIDARREVVVSYRAVADEESRERIVEPRVLFHRGGCWYLAGWNVEKGAEHLFRLDRIVEVEQGARTFEPRPGPRLDLRRRHLFFESGNERPVTIRHRGAAARLARLRWADAAREHADGTVSVTRKVTPGNYLYGEVLGAGGDAAIEGPPDVVAGFRARVEELRRLYADG
jgi:proteasome accessory factor B/proteasome accessory factor C